MRANSCFFHCDNYAYIYCICKKYQNQNFMISLQCSNLILKNKFFKMSNFFKQTCLQPKMYDMFCFHVPQQGLLYLKGMGAQMLPEQLFPEFQIPVYITSINYSLRSKCMTLTIIIPSHYESFRMRLEWIGTKNPIITIIALLLLLCILRATDYLTMHAINIFCNISLTIGLILCCDHSLELSLIDDSNE